MLDLSSKTPPPLRKGSNAGKATAKPAKQSKTEEREEGLNGLFQLGGGVALMLGKWADAGACSTHGPNIARETAAMAEKNERVGNMVDYLTAIGPYAGLLTAIFPFVLQIMVNHNVMPANPMLAQIGVLPPELVAAKAQQEVLEMQAQMQKEMAEAQKAAEEARAKLDDVA